MIHGRVVLPGSVQITDREHTPVAQEKSEPFDSCCKDSGYLDAI